ncbi:MAG: hypothetical protein D3918_06695 [Candidatus Electrothrix sp. AX2]|nr:hypothetical protein [Candidatus Electrothrix gigas]
MKSLFHSRSFSRHHSTSVSPLAVRTVPVTSYKLHQANRTKKAMNKTADCCHTSFSPGMLLDYTLFSYILAVDAGLTAKMFLRDRLQGKKSLPA